MFLSNLSIGWVLTGPAQLLVNAGEETELIHNISHKNSLLTYELCNSMTSILCAAISRIYKEVLVGRTDCLKLPKSEVFKIYNIFLFLFFWGGAALLVGAKAHADEYY